MEVDVDEGRGWNSGLTAVRTRFFRRLNIVAGGWRDDVNRVLRFVPVREFYSISWGWNLTWISMLEKSLIRGLIVFSSTGCQ